MRRCRTCEYIDFTYKLMEMSMKNVPDVEQRLYAKVCELSFEKGTRKIPSNCIGSVTSRSFPMKYCPSCGRRLKNGRL